MFKYIIVIFNLKNKYRFLFSLTLKSKLLNLITQFISHLALNWVINKLFFSSTFLF